MLKLLEVQGCIVTIDAIGTQKTIASTIIEHHADYILAVKGNQARLLEDLQERGSRAQHCRWQDVPHA